MGWELVNKVAVTATRNLVYADPSHLAGVRILGVDEHVWKHTRRPGEPSSMVTVLVDLTPLVDGRGSGPSDRHAAGPQRRGSADLAS